jgi:molybdenum cofactor synthesis domain-containing protein
LSFKDVRQKGFHKRIKLDEALDKGIKSFNMVRFEKIPVLNTSILNRILREDIYSKRDIPPFDRSAVDGYAIKAEDTFGVSEDSPLKLRIVEEVEIGQKPLKEVTNNTAIHISTGGVIPQGANAVVMIENTKPISESEILVFSTIHPRKNIANKGEDYKTNKLLFKSGHKFRSIDRSYILASGNEKIKVSKVPKIGIIIVGDELVNPSISLEIGQIPEINSYSISDLCINEGWSPVTIGKVNDDKKLLLELIKEHNDKYDVLLIGGGTSVGKKDIVPIVLNELGEILFHGLAIRPGGPVLCSKIMKKPVFGLPGFPTATIIAFLSVVKPIIYNYLGYTEKIPSFRIPAKISRNVGSKLGMLDFLRVNLTEDSAGNYIAEPVQISGSGRLSNIIQSNGIVRIGENKEGLKEGDKVYVELIFQ